VRSPFSLISLFLVSVMIFLYMYVCLDCFMSYFLFGCSESRGKEEKIIRLLASFSRVLVF